MRKVLVVFLGMVLMATLAMGLTATVSAQDLVPAKDPMTDILPSSAPTYAIDGAAELTPEDVKFCPKEEGKCWTARIIGKVGGFLKFWWENKTNLWQDGYRYEPGCGMLTGIPPMWKGYVEGFSFRYGGSMPGETTATSCSSVVSATPISMTFPVRAYAVDDGDKTNIRESASTLAKVLGQIESGGVVTLTGKTEVSGTVWYQVSPAGYVRYDRVEFTKSVSVESSTTTTITTTTTSTTTTDLSAYGVEFPDGAPTYTTCEGGSALCWKDPAHPVLIKLSVPQGGEYYVSGGMTGDVTSPIPAGTWYATGFTLYKGGLAE